MNLDFLPLLIALSCYKFYDLLMELGFLPLLMAGVCCPIFLLLMGDKNAADILNPIRKKVVDNYINTDQQECCGYVLHQSTTDGR